jgi:parallel beta-helix repeat protein
VLTLVKPSLLSYNASQSYNLPSYISGDTMKWNYNNLCNLTNNAYWNSFISSLNFTPDSSLNIGDTVCFSWFTTIASNDIDSTNNSGSICLPVVNSFDPNDKQASPKGEGVAGNIAPSTKEMNYTIRFQNTGNAVAYNVSIADTLDSDFDIRSLVITGTSHNCTPEIKGNVVNFNFYGIYLPDSNSNEPMSHGSVSYKLKLKPNLPLGTQLKNTAHIYFDNNPAIVTNSTLNTLAIPTAINSIIVNSNISLFPNPAQSYFVLNNKVSTELMDVKVINSMGRIVYNNKLKSMDKIDIANLPTGLYIVEIVSNSGISKVKLMKN